MIMAGRLLLLCVALAAVSAAQIAGAAETPLKAVNIAFPLQHNQFTCSVDTALGVDPKSICKHDTDPTYLWLNGEDVVSARYQYSNPVQLWKKGSKYVASFSAYFTVNFDRYSSEYTYRDLFGGGGIAFALTPSLSVVGTGSESLGLFPIDEKTGASTTGANTTTVAVEIDISRDEADGFDPQIPHIGLDINSVKSVTTKYLGKPAAFRDHKIGVWIDYNALRKTIEVYTHKVKDSQTPKSQNATLAIRYAGLELAKEVKEFSYVGFSSRVPPGEHGAYKIYDFTFSTAWVLGSTVN